MKESHKRIIEEVLKEEGLILNPRINILLIEKALIKRDEEMLKLVEELCKEKRAELKH